MNMTEETAPELYSGEQRVRKPVNREYPRSDKAECGSHLCECWHDLLTGCRRDMTARNYSYATIKGRMSCLDRFLVWSQEQGVMEPSGFTPALVRSFRRNLSMSLGQRDRVVSPRTINSYIAALKIFGRFLVKEGVIGLNPAESEEYMKKGKKLPRTVLTEPEVKRLLEAPDTGTVAGWRDRAVLEILYATGLRRSEVEELNVEDIDLADGFVYVREGKGGKSRTVPLGKKAGHVIGVYISEIRPQLVRYAEEKALLMALRGVRLRGAGIAKILEKYARRARITKKVTPHVMRHTFATHLVKNRANICHIQDMLGHESLDTTMVYTRMAPMELKEEHEKYHPREKWD